MKHLDPISQQGDWPELINCLNEIVQRVNELTTVVEILVQRGGREVPVEKDIGRSV